MRRMMARLRTSRLPESDFRDIVQFPSPTRSGGSQIRPCDFEFWRDIIVRFSLFGYLSFAERLPIIRRIEATLKSTPSDLAAVSFADIRRLVDSWLDLVYVMHFRKAASIVAERRGNRLTPLPLTAHA